MNQERPLPYVMIPVPEEFEQEVMAEVFKMTLRDSLADWKPESLRAIYAACDTTERALIDVLTPASVGGNHLSQTAVEEALHVSSEVLETLVSGVNGRCGDLSLPWLILRAPAGNTEGIVASEASDLLLITQTAAIALTTNGIVGPAQL